MNCDEYEQWAAVEADAVGEGAVVEARAHADRCPRCAALRSANFEIRALLRARTLARTAPPGLRTRIRANLDDESARRSPSWRGVLRWAGALAVAATMVAVVLPRESGSDALLDGYRRALSGEVALTMETAAAEALESFYAGHPAAGFPSHVVHLDDAGFRLRGAVLHEVDGRMLRLTVYSDGDRRIVCDYRKRSLYDGPLPEGDEALLYTRAGLSFCVRRVGDEICILVTRGPLREVFPRLFGWA